MMIHANRPCPICRTRKTSALACWVCWSGLSEQSRGIMLRGLPAEKVKEWRRILRTK